MEFHRELRKWILKVIRQRARMIKEGVSHKDPQLMAKNIDYLQRHLDYYPFDSDQKISGFFQRNYARIHSLLPGERSGGFQKMEDEFKRYDRMTQRIQYSCSRTGLSSRTSVQLPTGGINP